MQEKSLLASLKTSLGKLSTKGNHQHSDDEIDEGFTARENVHKSFVLLPTNKYYQVRDVL